MKLDILKNTKFINKLYINCVFILNINIIIKIFKYKNDLYYINLTIIK